MAEGRPLELSQSHDSVTYGGIKGDVTLYANDTYQPIIMFKIPRQVAWSIIKNPKVRMKLYDKATGDELPANVKLGLSVRKPNQELFQEIFTPKTYSTYRNLDIAEQLNKDFDGSVRFNLYRAGTFVEESYLAVMAKVYTDVTIDWSKSELYIGESAKQDLKEVDL